MTLCTDQSKAIHLICFLGSAQLRVQQSLQKHLSYLWVTILAVEMLFDQIYLWPRSWVLCFKGDAASKKFDNLRVIVCFSRLKCCTNVIIFDSKQKITLLWIVYHHFNSALVAINTGQIKAVPPKCLSLIFNSILSSTDLCMSISTIFKQPFLQGLLNSFHIQFKFELQGFLQE